MLLIGSHELEHREKKLDACRVVKKCVVCPLPRDGDEPVLLSRGGNTSTSSAQQ